MCRIVDELAPFQVDQEVVMREEVCSDDGGGDICDDEGPQEVPAEAEVEV